MKIGFIGAGKVGFSLGKYFSVNNITVSGYYSRNSENAKKAAAFTESFFYSEIGAIIDASDIIFITSCDSSIIDIWTSVYQERIFNKIICHCSGSLSGNVFCDAEKKGAYVCSVHPMVAIDSKEHSYSRFKDAFFTVEGDKSAVSAISDILNKTGNNFKILECNEHKALYHSASVFASNFVAALINISVELLNVCGFEEQEAIFALSPLILGNIDNILRKTPQKAFTGPIERNDFDTVKRHIEIFLETNNIKNVENIEKLYKLLSLQLIQMAKIKNPENDYSETEKFLKTKMSNIF